MKGTARHSMATDSSGEDTAFADCASSGVDASVKGGRRRQFSVPEMLQRAGTRKAKRQAPGRGSRSPPDAAPPAAKRSAATGTAERPATTAPVPAAVELSAGALASIQLLIDAGNARVISAIDAKIDILERRVSILEGECMDKDEEIRRLHDQLEQQGRVVEDLQQRVEGIDTNRRLSSLILACDDFVDCADEDIEKKVTEVVNKRFPRFQMKEADIQAAHRLQGKNKVIVRFVKRRLRDDIYDSRFELFSGTPGQRRRDMAPLFLTESLTPGNRLLYTALLDARKPENGGRVASVFTRRGQVICRTEKGGSNIRVPDWERLQQILERPAGVSPPAGRLPAARGRGGGRPPSRPAAIEARTRPSGRGPAPVVMAGRGVSATASAGSAVGRAADPQVGPAGHSAVGPPAAPAAGPSAGFAVGAAVSPAADPIAGPDSDQRMDTSLPVVITPAPYPTETLNSGLPSGDATVTQSESGDSPKTVGDGGV